MFLEKIKGVYMIENVCPHEVGNDLEKHFVAGRVCLIFHLGKLTIKVTGSNEEDGIRHTLTELNNFTVILDAFGIDYKVEKRAVDPYEWPAWGIVQRDKELIDTIIIELPKKVALPNCLS
jgi:hypothetical protein